ncbi:MAG TPA: hypothetical protein VFY96_14400 [Candidatus Binatia bacterium]|nr:hypothetical protein [Candidatus Binatia bacterium]
MHVEQEDTIAKFWLDPIRLQRSADFLGLKLAALKVLFQPTTSD